MSRYEKRNFQAEGVVIHRFNIFEADRIILFLTKNRGLLKARAKGVRKIKGKIKGPLELFVHSNIELAKGKNLNVITGAQAVETFKSLRKDLVDTTTACYISESLMGLTEEEDPQPEIFKLLIQVLNGLDSFGRKAAGLKKEKRDLLITYFLINLLSLSGFKPRLFKCVKCFRKIKPGDNRFDIKKGGVVCSECMDNTKEEFKITASSIKLMRLFLKTSSPLNLEKINVRKQNVKKARKILHVFLEYVLEKKVNSSSFLERVEREESS